MSENTPPASRSARAPRPVRFIFTAVVAAAILTAVGIYMLRKPPSRPGAANDGWSGTAPYGFDSTRSADGAAHLPPPTNDPHFQPRAVTATSGNQLINEGFEDGASGWKWLEWSSGWGPFDVGAAHVSAGKMAAHLRAHGRPEDPATRVFGVVQEIQSAVFPTRMSGRYYVERWQVGVAKKAYVQVVLIAMRPIGGQPTMQLRYVLDGMEVQPWQMTNARYIVVHPRLHPPLGQWVDFSLDLAADYRRLWGDVPPDGTGYRVLFEARYDDKAPGETVALDVWYDDLFVGTP